MDHLLQTFRKKSMQNSNDRKTLHCWWRHPNAFWIKLSCFPFSLGNYHGSGIKCYGEPHDVICHIHADTVTGRLTERSSLVLMKALHKNEVELEVTLTVYM